MVLSFAKWLHDICQLRQGFPKHTVSVNWVACYCQGLGFVFLSFGFLFNIFNFVSLFGLFFNLVFALLFILSLFFIIT